VDPQIILLRIGNENLVGELHETAQPEDLTPAISYIQILRALLPRLPQIIGADLVYYCRQKVLHVI
jgi:hypothetical protein